MRSPIDKYLLLPIAGKIIAAQFFTPMDNLKNLSINIISPVALLFIANFARHQEDNCEGKEISLSGRLTKSVGDAFAFYFIGLLTQTILVVIPFTRNFLKILAAILPRGVLNGLTWGLGVLIAALLINTTDSIASSQENICKSGMNVSRFIISFLVFCIGALFVYFSDAEPFVV